MQRLIEKSFGNPSVDVNHEQMLLVVTMETPVFTFESDWMFAECFSKLNAGAIVFSQTTLDKLTGRSRMTYLHSYTWSTSL